MHTGLWRADQVLHKQQFKNIFQSYQRNKEIRLSWVRHHVKSLLLHFTPNRGYHLWSHWSARHSPVCMEDHFKLHWKVYIWACGANNSMRVLGHPRSLTSGWSSPEFPREDPAVVDAVDYLPHHLRRVSTLRRILWGISTGSGKLHRSLCSFHPLWSVGCICLSHWTSLWTFRAHLLSFSNCLIYSRIHFLLTLHLRHTYFNS